MPSPNIYLSPRLPKLNLNCLLDRKLPERLSRQSVLLEAKSIDALGSDTGALEVIESNEIFGVQITWFGCFSGFISKESVSPSWGKTRSLVSSLYLWCAICLPTCLLSCILPRYVCLRLPLQMSLHLPFPSLCLSVSISYSIFSFCMSVFPSICLSAPPSLCLPVHVFLMSADLA